MKKTEIRKLKRLIIFSPIFGVVIGFLYLILKHFSGWSIGFLKTETLATVVAGFSFTMLGFLAAIAAFIFSLQKYRFFKRWIEDGNAEVFFTLFKTSIVCLFITFGFSLFVFTSQAAEWAFRFMMMSVTNNIFQMAIISFVIIDKLSIAKREDG
ncbi:hypothetical protein L4D76_10735 [Photobacterium sagamiensis]|uniref:hypothetical protein n=1 Tax=Photobacterium sagamiensis TaxID=2910241 RepID=UPI003D0BB35D